MAARPRCAVARSRCPERSRNGSVTIKGLARPRRSSMLGSSASAPPPTAIKRGVVMIGTMAGLPSARLAQQKAQDATGLLGGFEHLATGCLAEMLEVLRGARIG